VFEGWLAKAEAEKDTVGAWKLKIGDAAGATWQYLDEHGVTTLSKLRQGTNSPTSSSSWVSAGLREKGSYGSFGKVEL
jgi:hypothetical protein